jgi:hypothetical protein
MGLHLILGYASEQKGEEPFLVYAGYSGSEALEAKGECWRAARFEEFHHITGLKKRNAAFNAELAREREAAERNAGPVPARMKVEIPADLKGLKKDELMEVAVDALAQIKELEAALQNQKQELKPDADGKADEVATE